MAAFKFALLTCFLAFVSSSDGAINKVGDQVSVTCPFLKYTDVNAPEEVRKSAFPPFLDYIKDGKTVQIQKPSVFNEEPQYCKTKNEVAKEDCKKVNSSLSHEVTGAGDARNMTYTLVLKDEDGKATIKCSQNLDDQFVYPDGYTGGDKEFAITIVDPALITIEIDANATTSGLAEGEKLNATCKVPKDGAGNVKLVMKIGDEMLQGLSESQLGAESSTTLVKRQFHGKMVECYIEEGGVTWGDVKKSEALEVLFAPHTVTAPARIEVDGEKANKVVNCSAQPGNPAGFEWSVEVKDKKTGLILTDVVTGGEVKNESEFIFTVTVESNLEVKCMVKNSIGMNSAVVEIERITAPKVKGIDIYVNGSKLPDSKVDLGEDRKETINLVCDSSPSTATIKWEKQTNTGYEVVTEGLVGKDLELQVTHENDQDIYRCRASVEGQVTAIAPENLLLFLMFPVKAVVELQDLADAKKITVKATGNPSLNGLKNFRLDVYVEQGDTFYKTIEASKKRSVREENAAEFSFEMPKADLNKTYTFMLKEGNKEMWRYDQFVDPLPPVIVDPTAAPVSIGSGAVAGIIIAVILIVLCAILLVVMWRKGLLCAGKEPPAKAYAAGSTSASTAGALDAERGYASASVEDVNGVDVGIHNPAGPNSMNGYPPAQQQQQQQQPNDGPPESYYTPVIRNNGGYPDEAVPAYADPNYPEPNYAAPETDVENNLSPAVIGKEPDGLSDDSGVERNGHLPPETGV